jgi:hypothetical protein
VRETRYVTWDDTKPSLLGFHLQPQSRIHCAACQILHVKGFGAVLVVVSDLQDYAYESSVVAAVVMWEIASFWNRQSIANVAEYNADWRAITILTCNESRNVNCF